MYLAYSLAVDVPVSEFGASTGGTTAELNSPIIILVSEQAQTSDRESELEQMLENPVEVSQQEPEARQAQCLGLGPFSAAGPAQDLAERINALGEPVMVRVVDTGTGESDYRLVMPPLASLQEAFRKLRELKASDIDSYVISEGADAQGISLGVFTSEVRAMSLQVELETLGYDTAIREIPRSVRTYWVLSETSSYPQKIVEELQASLGAVGLRESVCLN